ncbi:MAG: hypothetical protein WCG91_03420 [Candidatus Shapirobacteria bacterium]
MSEKGGGEFLNMKYPDLQKSDQVQESVDKKLRLEHTKTPNHPIDRNEVFLDRLEHIFDNKKRKKRERNLELFRNEFLYPEVLVDKDNIPESYFELQKKIALEQGHGNIEITQEMREMAGNIIYNDQKKSLDSWIDYLAKNRDYPSWFKYYTLRNVFKMGNYDKDKKEFGKRSKTSTGLFPDLNEEVLSQTYDVLQKRYLKNEEHTDEELKRIVETANFSKIYGYFFDKIVSDSKEIKEKIKGSWVKFKQGSDSTVLYGSLQGHGTGWCTAGEEIARKQLDNGDFYVYYSKDEKNKDTVPRIAIRMQNGQVNEVRGVGNNQNLEDNMLDIAKEKYRQLPGGEVFEKKDRVMKRLTLVCDKVRYGQELNEDEVIFLYELREEIEGFGQEKDSRIDQTKPKLDILESFKKLTQEEDKDVAALILINKIRFKDIPLSVSMEHNKRWYFFEKNNQFSGEKLDEAWEFILGNGGDGTGAEFADGIMRNSFSGEELNKAWKFIKEKGGDKTAAELVGRKKWSFSMEEFDKVWEFIKEKGGDKTAAELVMLIQRDCFHEEKLNEVLDFILEKGGEETATQCVGGEGDRIWRIHQIYTYLPKEYFEKMENFIFEKGGKGAIKGLIFGLGEIGSGPSYKKVDLDYRNYLDKMANFIIEKGDKSVIPYLHRIIFNKSFSRKDLKRIKNFIKLKQKTP